jgi:aminoglycoside phosphotransferase (APT) family kinase protein
MPPTGDAITPHDTRAPAEVTPDPDPRLRHFLHAHRLAQPDERARFTPLAGGVSSDIWRVDLPGRSLCLKRALPRLNVAQVWRAPIERNAYEWAWIRFAAKHRPNAAPQPIACDPDLGVFAMGWLDPVDYPVWKRLLLDGAAVPGVAAEVGAIVAALHAASAGDAGIARRFATDAIFHAIRLEPYLIATARRHPDLRAPLEALAARTATTKRALVHGDVSPKNILLGPHGPVLLDAECAWYGDPAFDAAFCLNHFLLKCIARPASTGDYLRCFAAFAEAYLSGTTWEPRAEAEARIASLLPALLLARVDGKSPVEYVTAEADRRRVRDVARPLVAQPPDCVAGVAARWRDALAGE